MLDTPSLYDIPLRRIDGTPATLSEYRGKVLLVVNVASKCGFTPQYEALEALYRRYRDQGLVVLGFPSNDFGGQEPGPETEIAAFCRATYGVDFPLFSKLTVKGPDKHPLYQALIAARPVTEAGAASNFLKRRLAAGRNSDPEVGWNFEKFLVGRDGKVTGRFASDTKPDDPLVEQAIKAALAS